MQTQDSDEAFLREEARKLSFVWWPWGRLGIDPSADFPFIPALQALAAGRAPLLLAGAGVGGAPLSATSGRLRPGHSGDRRSGLLFPSTRWAEGG